MLAEQQLRKRKFHDSSLMSISQLRCDLCLSNSSTWRAPPHRGSGRGSGTSSLEALFSEERVMLMQRPRVYHTLSVSKAAAPPLVVATVRPAALTQLLREQ